MEGLSLGAVLGLDTAPFASGMLQAQSIASIFPSVVTSLMANPLLGIVDITKQVTNSIVSMVEASSSKLHELGLDAAAAGVSISYMSQMGAAFEAAGAGAGAFTGALEILQRSQFDALTGNKQMAESFMRLGIGLNQLRGLDAPALFDQFRHGLQGLPEHSAQIAIAMQLAGRGARSMLGELLDTSGAIERFGQVAKQLGVVVPDATGAAAESTHRMGAIFGLALEGMRLAASRPIMQYLADHSKQIEGTIIGVSASIRGAIGNTVAHVIAHQAEILHFAGTVQGVVTAGMATIGTAFNWLANNGPQIGNMISSAWNGVASAFTFVAENSRGVVAGLAGIGAAYVAMNMPAMIASAWALWAAITAIELPLLATAAAVGVAVAACVYFRKELAPLASFIRDVVVGEFKGMGDALKFLWENLKGAGDYIGTGFVAGLSAMGIKLDWMTSHADKATVAVNALKLALTSVGALSVGNVSGAAGGATGNVAASVATVMGHLLGHGNVAASQAVGDFVNVGGAGGFSGGAAGGSFGSDRAASRREAPINVKLDVHAMNDAELIVQKVRAMLGPELEKQKANMMSKLHAVDAARRAAETL